MIYFACILFSVQYHRLLFFAKYFIIILSQMQIEIGIKIPYTCLKAEARISRSSGENRYGG